MNARAMGAGVLAEFETPEAMLAALRTLRADGYTTLETYTPFDASDVDQVLERAPSRLPLAILIAGVVGAAGAYSLQWLTNAYWYPLRVGGRPPHFPLAYVPIAFEMGVLLAALTAFFGCLLWSAGFRLRTAEAEADGFERSSNDRFWIGIAHEDPRFDRARTSDTLRELGAQRVSLYGDSPESSS